MYLEWRGKEIGESFSASRFSSSGRESRTGKAVLSDRRCVGKNSRYRLKSKILGRKSAVVLGRVPSIQGWTRELSFIVHAGSISHRFPFRSTCTVAPFVRALVSPPRACLQPSHINSGYEHRKQQCLDVNRSTCFSLSSRRDGILSVMGLRESESGSLKFMQFQRGRDSLCSFLATMT